jgi:hypothetical protein
MSDCVLLLCPAVLPTLQGCTICTMEIIDRTVLTCGVLFNKFSCHHSPKGAVEGLSQDIFP